MKDEIKEIERILATSGKYITYAERCYVLDYITNLQDKYEEADNDRHALFEKIEKAIELLKYNMERYDLEDGYSTCEEALNILQGEDKDE